MLCWLHTPRSNRECILLSPADGTLPRSADCIPLSGPRCGVCYTLDSSAGPSRRRPPAASFGRHSLVAPNGLNHEAPCKLPSPAFPCSSQQLLKAPCRPAARCELHLQTTTLATTPSLPSLPYFIGHLLHESASYLGGLTHGFTAPPSESPCDAGLSLAPSSSHSGQTLMHQCNSYTPIVPRVTTNSICASLQLTTLLQPASPTPANATHASRPCPADSTLSCSALQTEPCRRLPLAMLCATHALALPASLAPVPVPGLT